MADEESKLPAARSIAWLGLLTFTFRRSWMLLKPAGPIIWEGVAEKRSVQCNCFAPTRRLHTDHQPTICIEQYVDRPSDNFGAKLNIRALEGVEKSSCVAG
jgi:hypothetical protein